MLLFVLGFSTVNCYVTSSKSLWWVSLGIQPCSHPAALSLPHCSTAGIENKLRKLMGQGKDRTSLANYCHGPNRLILQKISLIYCQLVGWWETKTKIKKTSSLNLFSRFNFTPIPLLPTNQCRGMGSWGCRQSLTAPFCHSFFLTPVPSFNVGPSHGIQLFYSMTVVTEIKRYYFIYFTLFYWQPQVLSSL